MMAKSGRVLEEMLKRFIVLIIAAAIFTVGDLWAEKKSEISLSFSKYRLQKVSARFTGKSINTCIFIFEDGIYGNYEVKNVKDVEVRNASGEKIEGVKFAIKIATDRQKRYGAYSSRLEVKIISMKTHNLAPGVYKIRATFKDGRESETSEIVLVDRKIGERLKEIDKRLREKINEMCKACEKGNEYEKNFKLLCKVSENGAISLLSKEEREWLKNIKGIPRTSKYPLKSVDEAAEQLLQSRVHEIRSHCGWTIAYSFGKLCDKRAIPYLKKMISYADGGFGEDIMLAIEKLEAKGYPMIIGNTKFRHCGATAAFSPDNKFILSAGNGAVNVWGVFSGRKVRSFKTGWLSEHATFSPDGKFVIVSKLAEGKMELYEIANGKKVKTFKGKKADISIKSKAFSPDGRYIVSTTGYKYMYGGGSELTLWDVSTGQKIKSFKGHRNNVTCLAFSPDGSLIASGSTDETIRLWDVAAGKEVRKFKWHLGKPGCIITSIDFSPDSRYIVAGGKSGNQFPIKLWDIKTGKTKKFQAGWFAENTSFFAVNSIAFSPDGKSLLIGCNDFLSLFDITTGKEIRIFKGHNTDSRIFSLAFSPDGKLAVSIGTDCTIRLWDVAMGKEIKVDPQRHEGPITMARFSPDGKYILSASADSTVKLWECNSGELIRTFRGHKGAVTCALFSKDGKYILSAGTTAVKLWNVSTGKEIKIFTEQHGRHICASDIAFSVDEKSILALNGAEVIVWDVDSGKKTRRFMTHGKPDKYPVVFSEDGKYLLSGNEIWDVLTGKVVRKLKGVDHIVNLTPDGKYLFAVKNNRIEVWDFSTCKEIVGRIRVVSPSDAGLYHLSPCYDPDIPYVAMAGISPSGEFLLLPQIERWDESVEKTIKSYGVIKFIRLWRVKRTCFSSDSKFLLKGNANSTLTIYKVSDL